jgi:hypothetical protein
MNHRFFGLLCITVTSALASACSSSDSSSDPAALKAPVVSNVEPMVGGLHITWENKQTDCDTIEGERMKGTDPYEKAFSVPGTADNRMDTEATHPMMYMYRLRCKKGDAYSGYSNEMSAMPQDGG